MSLKNEKGRSQKSGWNWKRKCQRGVISTWGTLFMTRENREGAGLGYGREERNGMCMCSSKNTTHA